MKQISLLAAGIVLLPAVTLACDLCAVYSANHAQGLNSTGWHASVAEQFTHFAILRRDDARVPDELGQRLDSSITQLVIRYDFTPRFGLQLNAPYISRTFRRPEASILEAGHERGWGDSSLLARGVLARRDTARATFVWDAIGGLKFPTGNTTRLAEEANEISSPAAVIHGRAVVDSPKTPGHEGHDPAAESGVHGHDLTLGTGSLDAIVGTSIYVRWDRFFVTSFVQYSLRRRGDYDYRFANDLSWEAAPGAYLFLGHVHTLAAQVVASGERKANDRAGDVTTDDTGITSLFLGPRLSYTHGMRLSIAAGLDFPVRIRNTGLQLTPDYRLRGNLNWSF